MTDTKLLSGTDRTAGWEVEATPRIAVVRLRGEIDLGVTTTLYESINTALSADPPADILCDLEHVSFLDSSGLHLLLKMKEDVEGCGGRFRVSGPNGSVRRLFDIVGASGLFEVVE